MKFNMKCFRNIGSRIFEDLFIFMSKEYDSYQDDPHFSLHFSNNKSSTRVVELVSSIKETLNSARVDKDLTEINLKLAELREHPESLFKGITISKPDPEEIPPTPKLMPIKPFLFPSYPTSVHLPYDDTYEDLREQMLTDSRTEHLRLLWSFQDRLTRDVCTAEEKYSLPPLQAAAAQIAKETGLPIHLVEKRKENIQSKFNSLIKKSQKKAQIILDNERKAANILIDRKQFLINQTPPGISPSEPLNLPIICPFSFLTEGGNTK